MPRLFTLTWFVGVVAGLLLTVSLPEAHAQKARSKPAERQATEKQAERPASEPAAKPDPAQGPKIQMAILLDTSGSMDGLINQARTQLWKVVNEFAKAKRDGLEPRLEVALFEYGKMTIDAEQNYLRMIVPLTDDLDKISEELFALTTNGGEEYCGAVIAAAMKQLKWEESEDTLKTIFIAGNEPFTQGGIDPYKACEEAIKQGVTVSTIHCGPESEGISTGWQRGAQLADGSFLNINQDAVVVAVEAPQDAELVKLSTALNGTYVFYGTEELRQQRKDLQEAQDEKAAENAAAGAPVQRALAKGGKLYNNADFDLVDGLRDKAVKLEDLKEDDLPEELKGKSLEEKQAYVREMAEKRAKIQEQIKKLNSERNKFVAEKQKELAKDGDKTLDSAVIGAVRQQAEKQNFNFDEE